MLSLRAASFDDDVGGLSKNSRKSVCAKLRTFPEGAAGGARGRRSRHRADAVPPRVGPRSRREPARRRATTVPGGAVRGSRHPIRLVAWHGDQHATPRARSSSPTSPLPAPATGCRDDSCSTCSPTTKRWPAASAWITLLSSELPLYQILYCRSIDEMILGGRQTMNFMQSAYKPKCRRGCHLAAGARGRSPSASSCAALQFALNPPTSQRRHGATGSGTAGVGAAGFFLAPDDFTTNRPERLQSCVAQATCLRQRPLARRYSRLTGRRQ
jgi:hypothetical protein